MKNSTYVFALATNNDQVYAGGSLTAAGSVPAQNIARWNGTNNRWEALGGGVNGWVRAIAVYGSYVYVGGEFTQAGGVATGPLARRDNNTQSWSSIGLITQDGSSATVSTIAVSSTGEVYVGGNFNHVAGVAVNNIARLTTSGWDAMGGGVTGATPDFAHVYTIVLSATKAYAGGIFNKAGGYAASNLAQWDGSWHTVGGGVGGFNACVNAIAYTGGNLIYVGGSFTEAYNGVGGTLTVHSIAAWNVSTSAWSSMSGGVDIDVNALLYRGDGLYVGGRFTTAGGAPARRVAIWSGTTWTTLKNTNEVNDGVDNNLYALAADSNFLFLGGSFEQAGDRVAHHVAAFHFTQKRWTGLGSSVNGVVNALTISGGYVYVGGRFSSANGILQAYLARWQIATHKWFIAGTGEEITGCSGTACIPEVNTILIVANDLYIGGNFTKIGSSLIVNGIARFNEGDSQWHALGSGVASGAGISAVVRDIALWNGQIFAGGKFTSAGGHPANNIAYWSSNDWHAIIDFDLNNGTNSQVYALNSMNGGVAIGGIFTTPSPYLALWNGSNWATLGTVLNGPVYAMIGDATFGTLVIGGGFTTPLHIARLKSGGWQAMGSGLNADVNALAFDAEGGVYAGGDFTQTGAQFLYYIAHWSHNAWLPVGSGMNAYVYALASYGSQLTAGGVFTSAGLYPSYFFGYWNKTSAYLPLLRK